VTTLLIANLLLLAAQKEKIWRISEKISHFDEVSGHSVQIMGQADASHCKGKQHKLRFLTPAELISFLKSYLICRLESLALNIAIHDPYATL
jgi:hypothetical protein